MDKRKEALVPATIPTRGYLWNPIHKYLIRATLDSTWSSATGEKEVVKSLRMAMYDTMTSCNNVFRASALLMSLCFLPAVVLCEKQVEKSGGENVLL